MRRIERNSTLCTIQLTKIKSMALKYDHATARLQKLSHNVVAIDAVINVSSNDKLTAKVVCAVGDLASSCILIALVVV